MRQIKKVHTENTGGNCMVTFVEIDDDSIVAISPDTMGFYDSMADFIEGEAIRFIDDDFSSDQEWPANAGYQRACAYLCMHNIEAFFSTDDSPLEIAMQDL